MCCHALWLHCKHTCASLRQWQPPSSLPFFVSFGSSKSVALQANASVVLIFRGLWELSNVLIDRNHQAMICVQCLLLWCVYMARESVFLKSRCAINVCFILNCCCIDSVVCYAYMPVSAFALETSCFGGLHLIHLCTALMKDIWFVKGHQASWHEIKCYLR